MATPRRIRVLAGIALLALATSPARADDNQPPGLLAELGTSMKDAAFHVDDRYPRPGLPYQLCLDGDTVRACELAVRAWKMPVIAEHRIDGKAVVQELIVVQLRSLADAKLAMRSFDPQNRGEFRGWVGEWGPMRKLPFAAYRCNDSIVLIRSRHRLRWGAKNFEGLHRHVYGWLREHCEAPLDAITTYLTKQRGGVHKLSE